MKKKYVFLLIGCFVLLTGCMMGQKEQFHDYLENHQYQVKENCLQKTEKKEDTSVLQRFCLEECTYYAMDSKLDDYFFYDIDHQEVNYIYEYITYKYNVKNKSATCLFQGEEIDLESSYCKNAKVIVMQHLDLFQQELDHANVKINWICIEKNKKSS